MAIYYDMYQSPQPEGEEKEKLYARVKSIRTLTTDELMKRVIDGTHLTKTQARFVLGRVVDELKTAVAQGFRIHVDELGYFSPQITAFPPKNHRSKSPKVCATGLNFVPEKEVKQYLMSINTVRTVNMHHAVNGIDKTALDNALRTCLEQEQTITRRHFQFVYPDISRTSLCNYLRQCVEQGKLRNIGTKNAPVYVAGKEWGK